MLNNTTPKSTSNEEKQVIELNPEIFKDLCLLLDSNDSASFISSRLSAEVHLDILECGCIHVGCYFFSDKEDEIYSDTTLVIPSEKFEEFHSRVLFGS